MGPAMLLTIGILFLLDNVSDVSFGRTWPAILLVIGVVKLMQSNSSWGGHIGPLPPGASGYPPPPPPSAPTAYSGISRVNRDSGAKHRSFIWRGEKCLTQLRRHHPPQFSPLPPLPPPRHRSFAGPFVLIVVGVLSLLVTMGTLSRARMWHLFANYWPVLLILWGVIKVIEHQQARREGTRASGIGAGGVLLIVMIVVFGLIANQVERVNWSGLRDQINIDDGDFPNIFGETFNYNDHLEQNFPGDANAKSRQQSWRCKCPRLG